MLFKFLLRFITLKVCFTLVPALIAAEGGALGDIASIKIKPYSAASSLVEPPADLPLGLRKYEGPHFGYGRLFEYNSEDTFGDASIPFTHRNILQKIKSYKKIDCSKGALADSNILMVRASFKATPPNTHVFECLWGIFASGGNELKKKSIIKVASDYYGSDYEKLFPPAVKDIAANRIISNLLKDFPEIYDYTCLVKGEPIDASKRQEDVYNHKLFRMGDPMPARKIFVNREYLKKSSGSDHAPPVPGVDPLKPFLAAQTKERLKPDEGSDLDDGLSTALFGHDMTYMFEEAKIGNHFNQSEPAFFQSLQEQDFDAFYCPTGPLTDTEYSVRLDVYSYRDICAVCRGSFSQVLANGWLLKNIVDYIKKSSERNFSCSSLELFAHSSMATDFDGSF